MLFDEFWFIKSVLVRFPLRVRVCLFDRKKEKAN